LIVSAERCFVSRDGSGSPVRGATGPGFFFGRVVVDVTTLVDVVEVVLVESARALVATTKFEHEPKTKAMRRERRIGETYSAPTNLIDTIDATDQNHGVDVHLTEITSATLRRCTPLLFTEDLVERLRGRS
jgi:hypothetical protein